MQDRLKHFESIVRRAHAFTDSQGHGGAVPHPFEIRNIHPRLPPVVRDLFDNGHFAQATFEAFKFVNKEIQRLSGSSKSGVHLMMEVFGGEAPSIVLTTMSTETERDEQKGYQFLFAGSNLAIRNPRGHEYAVADDPDLCLDHLGLASMLLRRLEDSGYR